MKSQLLFVLALCAAVGVSYVPSTVASSSTLGSPPPAAPELYSPADGQTDVSLPPILTWNRVDDAVRYEWQATRMNAFGSPLWYGEEVATEDALQTHSFTVGQVSTGIEVNWRIRAVGDDGIPGEWSPIWTFHTSSSNSGSQLGTPTLHAPEDEAIDVPLPPRLVWSRVIDADHYEYEASRTTSFATPDFKGDVFATTNSVQEHSFEPGEIEPNSGIYWHIRAVASDGTPGPWSAVRSFRTASGPLAAPMLLSPADGAVNVSLTPTLTWSSVPGAATYNILYTTSTAFESAKIAATSGPQQSYTIPVFKLTHSIPVVWVVQAVSVDGTEGDASDSFTFTTAEISLPQFLRPVGTDVFMPGRSETISWTGGNVERIDILYRDEDTGDLFMIAGNRPASDGDQLWQPAESMTCARCRIMIRRVNDVANNPVRLSDIFSVRGIQLKRRTAAGAYEYFVPNAHGWRFSNTAANLFPESWYSLDRFYYGDSNGAGEDILTKAKYPRVLFQVKGFATNPASFPDWISLVDAFGASSAYGRINPSGRSVYNSDFFYFWRARHISGGAWRGSCSGFASLALLVFHDPNALSAHLGTRNALYDFNPDLSADPNARSLINARQQYWNGVRQQDFFRQNRTKTPTQTLADVQAMLESETSADDGYLYIGVASGAHAITPYKITDDSSNPQWKRIYVYDPNWPGDNSRFVLVRLDTDRWSYSGFTPAWAGTGQNLFLMDPVANYHVNAIVPYSRSASKSADEEAFIEIFAGADAQVDIAGNGGAIGFANGESYSTIAGAYPIIPPVGGPTHPVGYDLPAGDYNMTVSDFPDSTAFASVAVDGVWYAYGRSDAKSDQSDYVSVSGSGMAIRSEDPDEKRLSLEAHVPDEGRTFILSDLRLSQSDSMKVTAEDGLALRVENMGGAKSYTLELRTGGADSSVTFAKSRIVLDAGSSHTILPDWQNIGGAAVPIEIDANGDGVTDETIEIVSNRAPDAAVITQPLSDVVIGGAPDTPFIVEWLASDDLDGDAVSYRWDLALSGEFAQLLMSENTLGTRVETDYESVREMLMEAGITAGESVPLFHRVVASDDLSETVSATVQVSLTLGTFTATERGELPESVVLEQNYPNPFNPSTVIGYGLPASTSVRLEVFDLLGRRIRVLINGVQPAGWHQVAFDAGGLPSGMYVYRLTAGSAVMMRQLLLAR